MRKSLLVLLQFAVCATCLIGCCGNEYCSVQKPVQIFDDVIITQFKEGFGKTGDNLRTVGGFLAEDFRTCGGRMSYTAGNIYDGASFSRCGKNMSMVADTVARQSHQGVENSAKNLQVIRKYLCICGD